MKGLPIIAAVFLALTACNNSGNGNLAAITEPEPITQDSSADYRLGGNTIDVARITSKGKVMSRNTIPIYSVTDGIIEEFNFKEGDKVSKGQVLLRLNDTDLKTEISELESLLLQKKFDVENALISQGYKRNELDSVPPEILHNTEVMLGYSHIRLQLENKRNMLQRYVVRAPFSGSLLNVAVSRFCYAHKGDPLFYLMDTDNLLVRFEVLETEIGKYTKGMDMEFTTLTYGDETFKATLSSIAPNVESTGTIVLYADIVEKDARLRPGMTVFINIAE